MNAQIPFDNSYARLPADFYAQVAPAVVDAPQLIKVNRALAAELGMAVPGAEAAAPATEVKKEMGPE